MDLKEIESCQKSDEFEAVINSGVEDEFAEMSYSRDLCSAFFFVFGTWGFYDYFFILNFIEDDQLPIHILNGSNFKGSCRIRLTRRKMR